MASIVIVTGAPGTGKTTVASQLARARPNGLHLPADLFFEFPAHPISPYRPAAQEQNTAIMAALAHAAVAFASHGYEVFLEGILGPWFLPVLAREILAHGHEAEYVVLRAPLDTALERVHAREGDARHHVVRQMHAAFAELGPYDRHAVDTGELSPEDVADAVMRGRAAGRFTLDLQRLASADAA
jgi:cytidylate kinase